MKRVQAIVASVVAVVAYAAQIEVLSGSLGADGAAAAVALHTLSTSEETAAQLGWRTAAASFQPDALPGGIGEFLASTDGTLAANEDVSLPGIGKHSADAALLGAPAPSVDLAFAGVLGRTDQDINSGLEDGPSLDRDLNTVEAQVDQTTSSTLTGDAGVLAQPAASIDATLLEVAPQALLPSGPQTFLASLRAADQIPATLAGEAPPPNVPSQVFAFR